MPNGVERTSPTRRAFFPVAAGACIALSASACPADDIPKPSPAPAPAAQSDTAPEADWLEPLVRRLNDDNLEVREQASKDLANDRRLTVEVLKKRITETSRLLSPEQLLRLNEVGVERLRKTPRAAMGVSFSRYERSGVEGVPIEMAVRGFDAERVVRPGDVIREMDGVPVSSNDDARAAIISHDPGEEVALLISRAGETINARVRLGSFSDLNNAQVLEPATFRNAWRLRCERGGSPLPEAQVVPAGLSSDQWSLLQAAELKQMRKALARRASVQSDEVATQRLVGGGAMRTLDGELPPEFFAADRDRNNPQARVKQQQIDNTLTQIRSYERALKQQPNMNAMQRRQYEDYVRQLKAQVNELKAEKRRLLNNDVP